MHTSDTQESRPPGAGSFLGSEHRFPLQLLHPHPGLVAPLVHELEAPTLSGFSSISSEVISFERSSGLGFLSVASLCLVVHMSWAPPAEGVMERGARFHCVAAGEALVTAMLEASSAQGSPWSPVQLFPGPQVLLLFYRYREAEEKTQTLESCGPGLKSHLYHSYLCALD